MAKRRRSREEIERWLRLREERGLSLREVSRRSGIPAGTLGWWVQRLRAEAAQDSFLEVEVRDAAGEPGAGNEAVAVPLEIRFPSGVAVALEGAAAERLTAALVDAVARW